MTSSWPDQFAGLATLPDQLKQRIQAESRVVKLPAATCVCRPGETPANVLLVVSGAVRVQYVSKGGREIVLYRIEAGESCALTTACLLGDKGYNAEGVTETFVQAIAIPRGTFDAAIGESPVFRQFVFAAFGSRMADLFHVIDDVAFSRIDTRHAQKLLQFKNEQGEIAATHQSLATELGTAREVVSRQLHEFQQRGWLQSGRGAIAITNEAALRAVSGVGEQF